MQKQTLTSRTCLGLLALGPRSAYDLVVGYKRTFGQISTRSDASIYNEPKRLVEAGLAPVMHEQRGRRTVAVYAITDAGVEALREWLGTPAGFPKLEVEPVVRVVFSDFGTLDDVRQVVEEFREEAVARATYFRDITEEYLAGETEYIERAHVPTTGGRFVALIIEAYLEWCDWALEMIATWEAGDEERRDLAIAELRRWAEVGDLWQAAGIDPPRNL